MSARTRVGVVVSGAGSNLTALLDACDTPGFPAEVVLVLSNRRQCGAIDIARSRAVEVLSLPVGDFGGDSLARDRALVDALRAARVELPVCAGYNRVFSADVLTAFPDILNVHPSLLPAFGGGMNAVEDALAVGVKVTGCTVHLLASGAVDAGPIVLQAAVAVHEDDDVDTLRARIHEQEWRLLPHAVELWATGRLQRDGTVVHVLPSPRVREQAR
ncbi:MAG: phosphoribosylglycinamide formyltransferase [Candidatus Dormibacteraeota bacterium]|uniref:Phosphoribosylglycinamide formyltransferase n=1 Tax=Candidatus Amunia macphersoniae TaxID=3127014 RepID=A0A934KLU3_9BACT|nr:phosphoribosylglycinamide formyltransferase [Candidatus Dormibacteraeota bacterium]